MRALSLLVLLFSATLVSNAQIDRNTYVQVSGEVLYPPEDTISIFVYSDGELIAEDIFIGKFYEFKIGARPHYTIKTTSGRKTKYCHIITNMMRVEKIVVDIDFNSNYNAIIFLKKSNANVFSMQLYNSSRVSDAEIERSSKEY